MKISTTNTPTPFLPCPTDRVGTTSRSSHGMVTLNPTPPAAEVHTVTRVRALHSFEPTEPNGLPFEKGDLIEVVNWEYKDWWQGQLKGRTGIFPVNYVEPLPEPASAELAAEAQQEAAVFSRAANFDLLLTMLHTLELAKDNLADNEEIQEFYLSCMALRPKVVKLIDKYSRKLADLVSMNESFMRSRTIFDRMMDKSIARHSERDDSFPQPQPTNPHVNHDQSAPYEVRQLQTQPQSQVRPSSRLAQQAPQTQIQTTYVQPYSAQDNSRALHYPRAQPQQAEVPLQPEQAQPFGQPQTQQRPQPQPQQAEVSLQPERTQPFGQPQTQQRPWPQPQQADVPLQPEQTQPLGQPQPQQPQPQPRAQTSHFPVETQVSVQPHQQQQQQQTSTGPGPHFDIESVEGLCSMGFSRTQAVTALEASSYNFQMALNRLLSA